MNIKYGIVSFLGLFSFFNSLCNKPVSQEVTFDMAPSSSVTPSSDSIYLKSNYSSYYFYNLNENYGYNAKGSCTYVAFSQLLSFWDTYWNDDIIPENYDVPTLLKSSDEVNLSLESPGIYEEPENTKDMSAQEYYDFIELHSGSYFQLHLIKIGKEIFNQYQFDNPDSPCGLSFSQLQELASYYLYNERGFAESEFSIETASGESAKAFTIQKIQQGIPVEIRVAKKKNGEIVGGHAMVAYDYDESTGKIYVHPGWHNNEKHESLDSLGYDVWWDATAIVADKPHSESDNFVFSSGYCRHTHCTCEFSIHPTHTINHPHSNHVFSSTYAKPDYESDAYHKAFCSCGEWKYEPHYYTNMYLSSEHHVMGYCSRCGGTFQWR